MPEEAGARGEHRSGQPPPGRDRSREAPPPRVKTNIDYYGVLGVKRGASPDEIKRAYRQLARQLHPDINPDPAAQERLKAVNTAYDTVGDERKRKEYDVLRDLQARDAQRGRSGAANRSPGGGSRAGGGSAQGGPRTGEHFGTRGSSRDSAWDFFMGPEPDWDEFLGGREKRAWDDYLRKTGSKGDGDPTYDGDNRREQAAWEEYLRSMGFDPKDFPRFDSSSGESDSSRRKRPDKTGRSGREHRMKEPRPSKNKKSSREAKQQQKPQQDREEERRVEAEEKERLDREAQSRLEATKAAAKRKQQTSLDVAKREFEKSKGVSDYAKQREAEDKYYRSQREIDDAYYTAIRRADDNYYKRRYFQQAATEAGWLGMGERVTIQVARTLEEQVKEKARYGSRVYQLQDGTYLQIAYKEQGKDPYKTDEYITTVERIDPQHKDEYGNYKSEGIRIVREKETGDVWVQRVTRSYRGNDSRLGDYPYFSPVRFVHDYADDSHAYDPVFRKGRVKKSEISKATADLKKVTDKIHY